MLADIVESLTGAIFLDSNKCGVSYMLPMSWHTVHSRQHMVHASMRHWLFWSCQLWFCCHASRRDLDAVWQVVHPLLQPMVHPDTVPIHPVRAA